MNNLSEKVIVVTGGSGLIGRAIIDDLLLNNATVINLDINKYDKETKFINTNTTDLSSIQEAFNLVEQEFGKIDGLVNNAYPRTIDWGTALEDDTNLNSWRENVDLQMNSYVLCCKEVLPFLKRNKEGSVINITSIYGVVGNDFTIYEGTGLKTAAAYSAIKGGLINFSRYMASFYGKDKIRFNCISPGGIFDGQHEVFVKNYEHKVPMKRMGNPQDIAPSVSFLMSDGAKYITGINLMVDGGWTCI